ncbi:hypothetical protein JKP88DRAFT_266993 [Tribonema minus]|uniref:Uncharacterized protein n=1 Tax=Tribonema minus TaxID=303371 RepID=A0A835ZAU6_9STRA|nr:hypothetical protein JKP88DRAFT_266993 [Tribonema minus]
MGWKMQYNDATLSALGASLSGCIIDALRRHSGDPAVVQQCWSVTSILADCADNKTRLGELDACALLIGTMRQHLAHDLTISAAMDAAQELAYQCRGNVERFHAAGVQHKAFFALAATLAPVTRFSRAPPASASSSAGGSGGAEAAAANPESAADFTPRQRALLWRLSAELNIAPELAEAIAGPRPPAAAAAHAGHPAAAQQQPAPAAAQAVPPAGAAAGQAVTGTLPAAAAAASQVFAGVAAATAVPAAAAVPPSAAAPQGGSDAMEVVQEATAAAAAAAAAAPAVSGPPRLVVGAGGDLTLVADVLRRQLPTPSLRDTLVGEDV